MAGGKENSKGLRNIVESALALWAASVIENQTLFDDFMAWESKNTSEENTLKNADEFVAILVYSAKGATVR